MSPTIVVAAYNRPASLRRLLTSLANAYYPQEVRLVISLDYSGSTACSDVAEKFDWRAGEKRIIKHSQNLGLRKHILSCGDLSREYGSIILLEDDGYVAPRFWEYAKAALEFYAGHDYVAGVALYSHSINQAAHLPFSPIHDGSDVFFLQRACSLGQAWTAHQWAQFRAWYDANTGPVTIDDGVPAYVARWPDRSWLKYFIKYLIVHDRYFVYPRGSLSTNFGDAGSNMGHSSHFQVHLTTLRHHPRFRHIDEVDAVYDCWCELKPEIVKRLNPAFHAFDFTTDLYGTKSAEEIHTPYMLTSHPCTNPTMTYGLALRPIDANVVLGLPGRDLALTRTEDVRRDARAARKKLSLYYYPELATRQLVRLTATRFLHGIRKRIRPPRV